MEGDKKKILIVDDDNFLLDMYALKFSQSNFEVYTAPGSLEAIEKLKGGLVPDLILMDIIMPEMDGFEMLEKINKENLSKNSIKIVLSNKSEQQDVDRGNALGVSGYIVKANSTPREVIEQVNDILLKKAPAHQGDGSR
ncbi:MAG TPA: response regulator [Candidatus Paceibacterota bacterium]|jgi:CheY-like chemotaxis protein|nr:response regulator [Candidatus Paceibacterota bacterium]